MSFTASVTSTTLSPATTPSLKSSKNASFMCAPENCSSGGDAAPGLFTREGVGPVHGGRSARAGQTVARSSDSGAHPSAIRRASTVKPLSLPPPRHLHQVQADASSPIRPLILIPAQRVSSHLARRIRHYPPADVGSCSTG